MTYNFIFSERKPKRLYAVDFKTIMGRKVEIFDTLEEANIFLHRVATMENVLAIKRESSDATLLEVEKIQQGESIYYIEKKVLIMI